MAKTKTKKTRRARGEEDYGVDISFVGSTIDEVVRRLEEQANALPSSAKRARRVVKSAIVGLKLTAAATKLHCGPRWFMSAE